MPEQIIEIQGDLIRRIERKVLHETNLKDIIPFMENRVPVTLPILPRHPVRAAYWDESGGPGKTLQFLTEVPPAVRRLEYFDANGPVAMPWTIFHFIVNTRAENPRGEHWDLSDVRIFWAQEQITDLDLQVIPAMVPNVYENGEICFGDTGTNPFQPLPDRIDQLINDFYLTSFNNDLELRFPWGSIEEWVEKSAEDRNCWKNFPEWDLNNGNVEHYQLKDLFTVPLDRSAPRTLGNDIPPLTFLPTFGRTREWLDGLTNAQRLRLRAEIEAMVTEAPDLFETTDA